MQTIAAYIALFILIAVTACFSEDDVPDDEDDSSSTVTGDDSSIDVTTDSQSSESTTTDASSESSTGEPDYCDPEIRGEHEPCGLSCVSDCAPPFVCTFSYAGGYLAECEAKCVDDSQCPTPGGVCADNRCVTPCGPDRSCGPELYCYPGTLQDGTPIDDPRHPVPHCMPLAG